MSIVARKSAESMKLPIEFMPNISLIRTAGSQCLFTNELAKNCELVVGKTMIVTDLLVLNIPKYDIVLGMNWLAMHGIKIDYAKREITLPSNEVHALVNSKELVYEMQGMELKVLDEIPMISEPNYCYAFNGLDCDEEVDRIPIVRHF